MLKHSPAPSEELYLTTKPKVSAAASRRSSHSLDLDKLARNIGKFNPSVPNSQNVQAYLQDIDFHLEIRPNVTDKDILYLLRPTSSPEVRTFGTRKEPYMEDELNLKTFFLRNLHPGTSHHLGVLACPRTMNTQQLRDLVQKTTAKKRWSQKRAPKPSSS